MAFERNRFQESPIFHTAGGEMPEVSRFGRLKERLSADSTLLGFERKTILWFLGGFLLTGLLTAVGIRLYRERRKDRGGEVDEFEISEEVA